MRHRSRWLTSLFVALLTALGPSAAALAQEGVIESVRVGDDVLEVTLFERLLPRDVTPQDAVTVRIDGAPVPADVSGSAPGPVVPAQRRTLVLLLDVSGSMQGAGLRDAQAAATGLLDRLPADVNVGLVTFASDVRLVAAPTTDRAAVRAALVGLVAAGDTRLFDAVPVALKAAGATGQRRVLVLSDGKDDGSTTGADQAAAAVRAAGVTVDVVDTSRDGSAAAGLDALAQAGKGRAVSVSGAATADVFSAIASTYQVRLSFTAPLPEERQGEQVLLAVSIVGADGATAIQERSVTVPLPAAAAPAAVPAGPAPRTPTFWLMLVAVCAAVFLALAAAITSGDTRAGNERRTRQVLGTYTLGARPASSALTEPSGRLSESSLAQSALNLADKAVQQRGSAATLTAALDRAALRWRPNEWLLLWFGSTVLGAALAPVLLGGGPIVFLLGGVVGWLAPRTWLKARGRARQKAFLVALPDALQVTASSLSSGYSLAQALDAMVQEGSEPMAGEIGRALAEARIGRPLEDALESVADRMECEDFRWVVMAVRVQRQVGGNLAEVLGRVCFTMRERASLRRQVRSLSAEGRISAWVLVGLPLALLAYMLVFNRDYFRPMYTETVGIVALAVTGVMMVIGALWMNKLVKVEL